MVKSPIGDVFNMHSGNLGKYLSKLLGNDYKSSVSREKPIHFKSQSQELYSLNGGKIVEKAKVFGNAKNMLNSMWLNSANQKLTFIHKRSLTTDSMNRKNLSLSPNEL